MHHPTYSTRQQTSPSSLLLPEEHLVTPPIYLQQQNEKMLLFGLNRHIFHSENLKMPPEELWGPNHYSFASYHGVFLKISSPRTQQVEGGGGKSQGASYGKRRERKPTWGWQAGIQDKQDSPPWQVWKCLGCLPLWDLQTHQGKRWLQATKTFFTQQTTDVKGKVPCLLKKPKNILLTQTSNIYFKFSAPCKTREHILSFPLPQTTLKMSGNRTS